MGQCNVYNSSTHTHLHIETAQAAQQLLLTFTMAYTMTKDSSGTVSVSRGYRLEGRIA